MSFPGFDFMKIIEEDWEDSKFFERLERKFLFIVYRTDEIGIERLEKVFYWNMPFEDREEARSVWERTKAQVRVDAKNLPKASESRVAHVRPKAKNAADTLPTPQGVSHTKQCFWLNQKYIQDIVRSS
jgi:DNA mismatch repair protein MutH